MSHWVSMHCTPEREELQRRHPQAWLLLCQIACRARWNDCSVTGLRAGQSLIGDWKDAGMRSPKAYVCAKRVLERVGAATFQGTSKGTIATLATDLEEPKFFSIWKADKDKPRDKQRDKPGASQGQARDKQGATNSQGYKDHKDTTTTSNGGGGFDCDGGDFGRAHWVNQWTTAGIDKPLAEAVFDVAEAQKFTMSNGEPIRVPTAWARKIAPKLKPKASNKVDVPPDFRRWHESKGHGVAAHIAWMTPSIKEEFEAETQAIKAE